MRPPTAPDSTSPLLYSVILNWNAPADTLACVEATRASHYPNLQMVIVDNASGDDSVARLRTAFPEIPILQNPTNLGYAEGNNVGIRHALQHRAAYVVLLNDDVVVEQDTFDHLVAAMSDPAVAAVGGKVRLFDAPEQLWAAGEYLFETPPPLDDGHFDSPREIPYAAGCCILLRSAVLEQIGLLDADYFMMHEEYDWCVRARAAGYHIRYVPQAAVRHKVAWSFTHRRLPVYYYLSARNQLRLWGRQGVIPFERRSLPGAALVWWDHVKRIGREEGAKGPRLWAATRGVWDYLRGRYGPPPEGL